MDAAVDTFIERCREIKAPVSRVWRALTDHREFGEWFGARLDEPFVAGRVARGPITIPEYEHITFEATVTAIEPERYFSFTWHPYAHDPDVDYSSETPTLVEFRLEPTATGTLLTIRESGFDRLPSHRRIDAFEKNDHGWAVQLDDIELHVAQTP